MANKVDSANAKRLLYRPISRPGSDKSVMRIREWIERCTTSHPRCQLDISGAYVLHPPKLPTRVIDVTSHEKDVSLFVSSGGNANYIALSHCWGGASLIRTTKSVFREHQQFIKYDSLSKTIQDAVYVVRELGIQYLWVDSLCIIQDDEEDWSREAKKMALVYEGAYLTIAATAAKDGTQGLFTPRTPQNLVEIPCNPTDPTSGSMYIGRKDRKAEVEVFTGPLNSRAWVLQERLFSRRTIHFASDQLYWECDKDLWAEDNKSITDPRGEEFQFIPTRSLLCYNLSCYLGKTQKPLPEAATKKNAWGKPEDFHSLWAHSVKFFSRCGLTKPSDKLPALQSLAERLAELTGHPYHEGHWFDGSQFCLTGLLWRVTKGMSLKKVKPARAPSWSWVSLEGPLRYLDFREFWVDCFHAQRRDMKILRVASFEPVNGEPTKALMLEAASIPCSMCSCPNLSELGDKGSDAQTGLEFDRVVSERGELIEGRYEFDLEEDQPSDFWLLPVYVRVKKAEPGWYVLLVSEVLNQKKSGFIFRRIGCGWTNHESWLCERERSFMVMI